LAFHRTVGGIQGRNRLRDSTQRHRRSHLPAAETAVVTQAVDGQRVLRIDGVDVEIDRIAGVDTGQGRIAFDLVVIGDIGEEPARGAGVLIFDLDRIGGLREQGTAPASDEKNEERGENREDSNPPRNIFMFTKRRKSTPGERADDECILKRIFTFDTRRKLDKRCVRLYKFNTKRRILPSPTTTDAYSPGSFGVSCHAGRARNAARYALTLGNSAKLKPAFSITLRVGQ